MTDGFQLTEEHLAFREVIREICADKIAPRAAEIDETGEFPWDVARTLADNGLLGLHVPEQYGGAGADTLTFAIMVEEIARVCASSSVIPLVQKLGSMPLLMAASDEQKQRWFPAIASGEDLISYCSPEADAGSDPTAMRTTAVRDGDAWVLNGTKTWISMASASSAFTVLVKTTPDKGARGISAFYVRGDDPGFSVGKAEDKLGIKGSPTCQVHFDDCRIPADRLLGEVDRGLLGRARLDPAQVLLWPQARRAGAKAQAEQRQPVEEPVEDQVEQAQRYAHDLARSLVEADYCRSGARADFWNPQPRAIVNTCG